MRTSRRQPANACLRPAYPVSTIVRRRSSARRRRVRAALEPCECFVVAIRKQRVCGHPVNCPHRRLVEREHPGSPATGLCRWGGEPDPRQPEDRHERGSYATGRRPEAPNLHAIGFDRCNDSACPSLRAHFGTQSYPAPGPPGPRRILHPQRLRCECCIYLQSLLLWSRSSWRPQEVNPCNLASGHQTGVLSL